MRSRRRRGEQAAASEEPVDPRLLALQRALGNRALARLVADARTDVRDRLRTAAVAERVAPDELELAGTALQDHLEDRSEADRGTVDGLVGGLRADVAPVARAADERGDAPKSKPAEPVRAEAVRQGLRQFAPRSDQLARVALDQADFEESVPDEELHPETVRSAGAQLLSALADVKLRKQRQGAR